MRSGWIAAETAPDGVPLEWFTEAWGPFDPTEGGALGRTGDEAILIFSDDYAGPLPREGPVDAFPDCWVAVR